MTKKIARTFCGHCNWAYESWVTHKQLFDNNTRIEQTLSKAEYFTQRLSIITQEYVLLQICKLHDPATMGNFSNISIECVLDSDEWGENRANIEKLTKELTAFFENLKPARQKILAHNDKETGLRSSCLGEFEEGLDERYFTTLHELANEVSRKWLNRPFIYNDLAKADVDEFLNLLECLESQ